jgi:hypothetical protein
MKPCIELVRLDYGIKDYSSSFNFGLLHVLRCHLQFLERNARGILTG